MAEVVEIRIIPGLRLSGRRADVREIATATVSALRDMQLIKENYYEAEEFRIPA
jgi:hypothetical protein